MRVCGFKQKTAYEMRISDWSSDVCSSDLDMDVQARIKFETEGVGFTDFSDRKNRGYFESTYVRTPGGVMFEATHSLGFTHDEDEETLGMDLKVSPQFDDKKHLIQ